MDNIKVEHELKRVDESSRPSSLLTHWGIVTLIKSLRNPNLRLVCIGFEKKTRSRNHCKALRIYWLVTVRLTP